MRKMTRKQVNVCVGEWGLGKTEVIFFMSIRNPADCLVG